MAFAACDSGEEPLGSQEGSLTGKRYTYFLMNTSAQIVVYDDFTKDGAEEKLNSFNLAAQQILREEVEGSLSVSKEDSCISKFNGAAAGETVRINKTAYDALKIALGVYGLTDGYYNPAVYYSVQGYGFNGGKSSPPASLEELPTAEEVEAYTDLAGHFGEITLSEKDGEYFAQKPAYTVDCGGVTLSLKIDLGGVGKGYAADKINELFEEYGYNYGYFNIGSSSICFKKFAYDDNLYTLELTDPRAAEATYFRTHVADTSLSSGGDYENFYMLDTDGDGVKERLCHIIDPTTGRPVNGGIMAATVIGGSAAEDDALTTALMAMGKEKARKFIAEKLGDRKVVFAAEGAQGYTYYTNMPQDGYEVNFERFTFAGDEDVA